MDPVTGPPPHARSSTPTELPNLGADTSRPTHHLEKIKVGNHGVQLLVSTKDHLYDANDVEAGEDSWQVIGAWEDSTVSELTQILSQRSTTGAPAQTSAQSRFGAGYGVGNTLGTTTKQSSDTAK